MNNPYSGFNPNDQLRPAISREDFFGASGFEFGWNILAPINIAKGPSYEPELVKRFSPGQKALYFWWFLDAQVTNGGFVQFYFNRYNKYIPAIIAGMKAIGDPDMEALVRKAHDIALANPDMIAKGRRENNLSDLYKDLPDLGALDDQYFQLHHETMAKIELLAKRNPWDFCTDEKGKPYDPQFTGTITTSYSNNQVKDVSHVVNGIIEGEFLCFFESGQKKSLHTYVYGQMTGLQQTWRENGHTRKVLQINRETGVIAQEAYGRDGTISKRYHLDLSGEKAGPFWEYYPDGSTKTQGFYGDRYNMRGEFLVWWENGQMQSRSEFTEQGKIIHDYWTQEGEQLLKNGTGIFVSERESASGITRRVTSFVDHRTEGITRVFENGILKSERPYKNGMEEGSYREFDPEGNVTLEEIYKDGKKVK